MTYSGRFAPSPTGPLHLGSLLAAVASWLDARAHQGKWHLRIEDIDPPRQVSGSDALIIQSLEAHGLQWDDDVIYQSSRIGTYRDQLEFLAEQDLAYCCDCSRSDIAEMGGAYDGRCRDRKNPPAGEYAWRFRMPDLIEWSDIFAGAQHFSSHADLSDPVIWRKDGLVAYHLAAALDDTAVDNMTVVRGSDLLDSTTAQLALIDAMKKQRPTYGHIPVLVGANNQKLSKQNHAQPLDDSKAPQSLSLAIRLLGQRIPEDLIDAPVDLQLDWATSHWDRNKVPATQVIRL